MRHAAILIAALFLSLSATAALQAGIAPSPFTLRLGIEPSPFVPPGGQLRFTAYLTNKALPGTPDQKFTLAVRGDGWSSDTRPISCPKPGGTVAVRFATPFSVPTTAKLGTRLTFVLVDAASRVVPPTSLCAPAVAVVRATASMPTQPVTVGPAVRPDLKVRPDFLAKPDLEPAIAVYRDKAGRQPVAGDFIAKEAVTLYVRFSVANLARGAAGAFRSLGKVSDPGQAPKVVWHDAASLDGGAHLDFPLVEHVVKNPSNRVELSVAADQLGTVDESNETNNKVVRTILVTIR